MEFTVREADVSQMITQTNAHMLREPRIEDWGWAGRSEKASLR